MMITDAGTLVRTRVAEVSIVGRNTQGVTLIRTAEDEKVVGLQRVVDPEEEEEDNQTLIEDTIGVKAEPDINSVENLTLNE